MDNNHNQQSDKNTSSNNFIDILMKYSPILTAIILGISSFLDYRVFTDTFNLYTSTFLDAYTIDALNGLSLLTIIIVPLVLSLFMLSLAYISAFIPWSCYLKIKKTMLADKNNWSLRIGLLFVHFSIILILSLIIANIKDILFLALMLSVAPLVINMLIFLSLLAYIKVKKLFSTCWSVFFTVIYIIILFICSFIILSLYLDPNLASILGILYLLTVLGIALLPTIMISEVKTEPIKDMPVILSFLVILVVLSVFGSDDENNNIWSSNKDSNSSYSLRINKLFLSDHPIRIDVNTSDFNLSTTKLKYITDKYLLEKINNNILSFQNSKYLPLSKESKLYFVNSYDNNITFVFAIKQKYNQGIYDYRLMDIGFIKMTNK